MSGINSRTSSVSVSQDPLHFAQMISAGEPPVAGTVLKFALQHVEKTAGRFPWMQSIMYEIS